MVGGIDQKDFYIHISIYQGRNYQSILTNVLDCNIFDIIVRCRYEINLITSMNKQVIDNSKQMLLEIKKDFTLEDCPELWI